jgi:hypothetical protein
LGCGSSSKETDQPSSPESSVLTATTTCEKYVALAECTLSNPSVLQSGEDIQPYLDALKADINTYPEDQQEAYCTEKWEEAFLYSGEYANFGCPME